MTGVQTCALPIWAIEAGKRLEHRLAHVGPLLALLGQAVARGIVERFALVQMMIMSAHGIEIGAIDRMNKRLPPALSPA